MKKELISYTKDGDWSGYTLQQRPDGLWRYEGWCAIQGCSSGRVAIIEAPEGLNIRDEADLDTMHTDIDTKSNILRLHGTEVRCLRKGHTIR